MASYRQDIKNFLLYGTPNVIAFTVVHSSIYCALITIGLDGKIDIIMPYVLTKDAFKQKNYLSFFTSTFLHSSPGHLASNTLAFIPNCYRAIYCIDYKNKKRSSYIFWSLYLTSGVMGNIISTLIETHYKQILLFIFKNNNEILNEITKKYDRLNATTRASVGASGGIMSLYAFNCLLSMELILKRCYNLYKYLDIHSDGLIDITDEINLQYNILDYDLDTPEGETIGNENNITEGHIDEVTDGKATYHTIKFFEDTFWMLYCGYSASVAFRDLYKIWKYGMKKIGGETVLTPNSNTKNVHLTGHLGGAIAGIVSYCAYKLLVKNSDDIMSASCVRKRKLNDDEQISQNDGSPSKKLKLDDSKQNECKDKETTAITTVSLDEHSFDITIGSINTINLFALHTINNTNSNNNSKLENENENNNELNGIKLGETDWKFEFYEMPTDSTHDIYQFLDGLFGDKLCDWKEYIMNDNKYENKSSNNFITIIKDEFGIWRGAILFIIYELIFKDTNEVKYLIKIPLTGVDLHFRRQNIGTILVNYTVSMVHKIMGCDSNKYEIIVLVIDETQPKSFWNKNNFVCMIGYKGIEYSNIFEKDLMIKKGFLKSIENELIIMIYSGEKSVDLVLNDERVTGFVKPKYVNFNQKYCKKDEIEETEKNIKEWERKKKELEEKQKQKHKNKNNNGDSVKFNEFEFDDDESDEDFDVEKAIECQSSDSDENDNNNNKNTNNKNDDS